MDSMTSDYIVVNLHTNLFNNLKTRQELIRLTTMSDDLIQEYRSFGKDLNELVTTSDKYIDKMIEMLQSSLNDSKINEHNTITMTPIVNGKRKNNNQTPGSIMRKNHKKKCSIHKDTTVDLNNNNNNSDESKENQTQIVTNYRTKRKQQRKQSILATKNSIDDSETTASTTTMCTRARTRAQKKLEEQKMNAETPAKTIVNNTVVKNTTSINKSNHRHNRKIVETENTATKKLENSNARLLTPAKRQIKPYQPVGSVKKNENPTSLITNTPKSKKNPVEILVNSVKKVEKAAENRKKFLENKQQQIRHRSLETKNRIMANKKKQEDIKQQQPKSKNAITTPAKRQQPLPCDTKQAIKIITGKVNDKLATLNHGDCTPMSLNKMKLVHLNSTKFSHKTGPSQIPSLYSGSKTRKNENNDKTKTTTKTTKKLIENDKNEQNYVCMENLISEDSIETDNIANLSPIKFDVMDNEVVNVTVNKLLNSPHINHKHNDNKSDDVYTTAVETPMAMKPLNKTILKIKQQEKKMTPKKSPLGISQYIMTPPPRFDGQTSTYDISGYIESKNDDYYNQIKHIPMWARGKFLEDLNRLHCSENGEENIEKIVDRIYANKLMEKLDVDLNAMGLDVIPRYKERTSSVIWSPIKYATSS